MKRKGFLKAIGIGAAAVMVTPMVVANINLTPAPSLVKEYYTFHHGGRTYHMAKGVVDFFKTYQPAKPFTEMKLFIPDKNWK